MPRWVKFFVAIGALVLLLLVVTQLVGGGHGPRRHGNGAPSAGEPARSVLATGTAR